MSRVTRCGTGPTYDVSRVDDMYELLAGFMTDYSSAAFDAAVMRIPVFLYADDYAEYEKEQGKLLRDLRGLPFSLVVNDEELEGNIQKFEKETYQRDLEQLFCKTGIVENEKASMRVVKHIEGVIYGERKVPDRN